MFKFDFEVEQEEDSDLQLNLPGPSTLPQRAATGGASGKDQQKCYHVTLDELLDTLPEAISYSPLWVDGLDQPILRRDLFDARFQLSQKDVEDANEAENAVKGEENYVDSSTDLVPGQYEGGLKTWEGGVDLVEVLSRYTSMPDWLIGAKTIEVGCGTAIPTAYLLSSLFASPPGTSPGPSCRTTFHLQDFNRQVLELVTLPNLLLALLPHLPVEVLHENTGDDLVIEEVVTDLSRPGNISITPEVKGAFKGLLQERGTELRFSYGYWKPLSEEIKESEQGKGYDLVLTSETIYSEESVDDLIDMLRASFRVMGGVEVESQSEDLEEGLDRMKLDRFKGIRAADAPHTHILVAAKVLYFGVGGGLQDFIKRVEALKGYSEDVKEWRAGVGRKVVRIGFEA